MDTPCLILADGGRVLGRYDSHSAATHAAHTTHAAVYAWVTTLDGVTLRHRHGRRPKAPPAVWPTLTLAPPPPPGCPVLAALRQPRTLDEVLAVLPGWERAAVSRRLLTLWDEGVALVRYEGGVAVWSTEVPS